MNYPESQLILEEIKKAKRILINCHFGADPDGIGSTLSLYRILLGMDKEVKIICPSKTISKQTDYLENYKDINLDIDIHSFDFQKYDLFIILDSSDIDVLTGKSDKLEISIPVVVVDHHYANDLVGTVKLVDGKASSVGEMLYKIYQDWGVTLDKEISQCLLTSIIGDTGTFSYAGAGAETLRIGADLISLGADKTMISDRIFRAEDFKILKFWSEVLSKAEFDEEYKFVWSATPYKIYEGYKDLPAVKSKTAAIFAPLIDGTNFGFIAVEENPKVLSVSFRGRNGFDTSKIAYELGGGGHPIASAVRINGLDFDTALIKVLEVCRKYARKG